MKMAMADCKKPAETWPEMKEVMRKVANEVETESSGSSEAETESPRSVGRWRSASFVYGGGAVKACVHSQVLRIREEELCVLVEDKAATAFCYNHEDHRDLYRRRLNLVLVSRPILPCSPLSGKISSFKALQ